MTTRDAIASSWQRTVAILKATAVTVRQHPRLLWFPMLGVACIFATLVAALVLSALFSAILGDPVLACMGVFDALDGGDVELRGNGVIGLATLYGVHVITVFTGVALTHAATEAMSERPWSVERSLDHARARLHSILGYAVAAWLAGVVLGRRRKRRGPGLLRFAWRAATYLVLPVISREGKGPVEAIQRSARLVRDTWQESLMGYLTLRWVWVPFVFVLVIPVALLAILEIEEPALVFAVLCTSFAGAGVLALFLYTVEVIYRAALYIFATEGVVPEPYDCDELHCLWSVRGAQAGDVVEATAQDVDEATPPAGEAGSDGADA
ncbi:MAG: hypothetical protein KC636_03970 [Myxococcales bacterium]|nr:hypothetical protein [Myxococcales bacterium]